MAARHDEARLIRTLRLLRAIAARRHGARVQDLVAELDVSRTSLYRYLKDLEKGAGLLREDRNGEAWVRMPPEWGTKPGVAEVFALVVAKQVLRGLSGTKAQTWLEPRLRGETAPLWMEATVPVDVDVARAVEASLTGARRRLSFTYRGFGKDEDSHRRVEPIELRFSQRAWQLFSFDVDKRLVRTFKLARMRDAKVLNEACTRTDVDPSEAHANSVAVWQSKEVHDVVIRLHPPWAAVAHEYPLQAAQHTERDGDDAVIRARVAGLEEVLRWVLRFGGDVTVVEPAALREKVRAEHERALRRFTGSSHPPETPVGDVFLPKAERVVGAKRLTSTVGRRSIRS